MALSVLIGTTGLVALKNFGQTQDRQGTADEVVSVLRTTAQQSLSEGRTYCVSLNATSGTWEVWRVACDAGVVGTRVQTGGAVRGDTRLGSVSFTTPATNPGCPTAGACAYFYPRGTATPGSIAISWGVAETITVTVEGLSSRVSRS